MPVRVACCFTGGKDSYLVSLLLRSRDAAVDSDTALRMQEFEASEVALLVTFAPAGGPPFKAHPMSLIKLQAEAMGLPHLVLEIHSEPSFLDSYRAAVTRLRDEHGIQALATGDILDVCNNFMGRATEGIMPLWRPLWGMSRLQLLELLWGNSVQAVITCINMKSFGMAAADSPSMTVGGHGDAAARADEGRPSECGSHEVHENQALHGSRAKSARNASSCDCSLTKQQASPDDAERQQALSDGATFADAAAAGTAGDATAEAPVRAASLAPNDAEGSGSRSRSSAVELLLGQQLSRSLHQDVLQCERFQSLGVDECGERGEFHTMVVSGGAPQFWGRRLDLGSPEVVMDGEFAFLQAGGARLLPPGV